MHEVRDAALRIIFALYRKHRAAVLQFLPPAHASTRRSLLYKTLFDGFTKIDGKGSEAEVRVYRERTQHRELPQTLPSAEPYWMLAQSRGFGNVAECRKLLLYPFEQHRELEGREVTLSQHTDPGGCCPCGPCCELCSPSCICNCKWGFDRQGERQQQERQRNRRRRK